VGEIFVSYSNHDQDFATALNQWLARSWIGDLDRQGGYSSRRRLAGGHQSCTCGVSAFLIVLSPNCIASKNVVKELSIAESRSRHIVPVMYQACEIPPEMEYQLAGLQWINFPEMGFDQAIKRLVATLEKANKLDPTSRK
jgi:hypothetical protein